jgi:hypothetical protein
MDKKELRKLIRSEFDVFLKGSGFSRRREGVYVRVIEDVIHNISFEMGSIGFTCAVAMQPLYVKEHKATAFLQLTFGNRLGRFKVTRNEWWPYDEPEKGLAEIKRLLNENGLPWFERYGTPEGIIDFITSGKVEEYGLWLNRYHQNRYLGFSLLYIGRTEEGIRALRDMLGEIGGEAVEWMQGYKTQIMEFIDEIGECPDKGVEAFDNIVRDNRIALKI